jgi:hypothetical protein
MIGRGGFRRPEKGINGEEGDIAGVYESTGRRAKLRRRTRTIIIIILIIMGESIEVIRALSHYFPFSIFNSYS